MWHLLVAGRHGGGRHDRRAGAPVAIYPWPASSLQAAPLRGFGQHTLAGVEFWPSPGGWLRQHLAGRGADEGVAELHRADRRESARERGEGVFGKDGGARLGMQAERGCCEERRRRDNGRRRQGWGRGRQIADKESLERQRRLSCVNWGAASSDRIHTRPNTLMPRLLIQYCRRLNSTPSPVQIGSA